MTKDQIDTLLSDSAPQSAQVVIPETLLREMVQEAREAATPASAVRTRRRNITISAVLAGALVIGGGGVAVASGLVPWPGGYETPDNAFPFTLPSGRACEMRMVIGARPEGAEQRAIPDKTQLSPAVQRAQRVVADWLHNTDLLSSIDLSASEQQVDSILEDQRAGGTTVIIDEDGWLTDANIGATREADADDRYAFVVDRALRAAMREQLAAAGVPESDWTFGVAGGVKCAAE